MKYIVEITETLAKRIEVEADSSNDARTMVQDMYETEQIVLSSDDFDSVSFDTYPSSEQVLWL